MRTIVGSLALIFLLWLPGGRGEAVACVCGLPAAPPCRLTAGDVVFVGTVTQATIVSPGDGQSPGKRKFVFDVQEAFAGAKGPRLEVYSDMTSCGAGFAKGETYLVDAGEGENGTV